ncbi:MAG: hypothetical protein Q8R28_05475 [Dehalococcoidia bacterium]|nr:hypothetical protein [Dehalococcoidia bacterium]
MARIVGNPSGFGLLRELASEAVQEGVRRAIGDVAKSGMESVRQTSGRYLKDAIGTLISAPGLREGDEFATDEHGIPKWFWDQLRQPWNSFVISGERGLGKTSLSLVLGEFIARGDPYYMLQRPEKLADHVETIETMQDIAKLPEGIVFIIDDANRFISSRNSMSPENKEFVNIVFEARHMGAKMIVNAQTMQSIDKFALDFTLLFIKPPIFGWEKYERPPLIPIIKRAQEQFARMTDEEKKQHVWVFKDDNRQIMLKYSPPDWYTTDLSKFRGSAGGGGGGVGGRGGGDKSKARINGRVRI